METLVGVHKEITQSERRFFCSCEKDGTNSNARRRYISRRRVDRGLSQSAPAKRTDHKIPPAIQRTRKTTAADHRHHREHGRAKPEDASAARFRADHCARRSARARPATAYNAHRPDTFETN